MNKILLCLSIFISALIRAEDSQPARPVRPTVFLIALNPGASGHERAGLDEVVKAIQAAANKLYITENQIQKLSFEIENILIYEEKEFWVVSFIKAGNGRVAFKKNGEVYKIGGISLNPDVLKVNKNDYAVSEISERTAVPWLMGKSSGFLVKYDDATDAEIWEYNETLKITEQGANRQDSIVPSTDDSQPARPVRPTVLLIILNPKASGQTRVEPSQSSLAKRFPLFGAYIMQESNSKDDGKARHDEIIKTIQVAIKSINATEDKIPKLPGEIENILIYEEREYWIVAFFQAGNGRMAYKKDGVIHYRENFSLNPDVVKVNKSDYTVSKSPEQTAVLWPMSKSLGLLVNYNDATDAEIKEYEEILKRGGQDENRKEP